MTRNQSSYVLQTRRTMNPMQLTSTESSEWARFACAISDACPRFAAEVERTAIEGECPFMEFDRIGRAYRAWLVFGEVPQLP